MTLLEGLLRRLERSGDDVVELLTDPVAAVAVAIILAVELLRPARPKQPVFSRGFCQDLVWYLVRVPLWAFTVSFYGRALGKLFRGHLSFLRLDLSEHWPEWALIAFAFVIGDLLAWLHHWARHKVPWFWRFHKVHHSQREMNLFADHRVHFVEWFIIRSFTFVPFFVIGGDYSRSIFLFGVIQPWYAMFYHANIRANFGWLRNFVVTPQYHRVHHSVEREHQDRNFGDILTVWDRLFGTMWPDFEEYPDTGVADPDFPVERSRNPLHLLGNYARQLAYPFRDRA